MRQLALFLFPAALLAGQARYARLGEFEGKVEVQVKAADAWQPAARNLVLGDSSWIRTGTGRVEIELDDGGVLRLEADALAEISDYTRLSTGQRLTVISLDRGLAYFTGAAEGKDVLVLAVPAAQATVRNGARVRLHAGDNSSHIAVIEGTVRFSSTAAEVDVKEGQTVRVEPSNTARFFLYNEVTALAADRWSEERDKALASSASAAHVPGTRYGAADLDQAGSWIDTADRGTVWRPKAAAGWAPFRNGRWVWMEDLGYTWISSETWGWLPFHYGRWMLDESSGWVWVPGKDTVFSPGDVYWLRGSGVAAWGPLAPAEQFDIKTRPQLYLSANTTYAAFTPEARELDPAGYTPPKQPVLAFVAALPSPALPAGRLEARRPELRAGSTRVVPHLTGVTYDDRSAPVEAARQAAAPEPQPAADNTPAITTTVIQPPPQAPVIVEVAPPEPPAEVYYPVPVYTGIVVMNPPDKHDGRHHHKPKPPHAKPEPKPEPAPPLGMPRTEEVQHARERATAPSRTEKSAEAPKAALPRSVDEVRSGGGRSGRR